MTWKHFKNLQSLLQELFLTQKASSTLKEGTSVDEDLPPAPASERTTARRLLLAVFILLPGTLELSEIDKVAHCQHSPLA